MSFENFTRVLNENRGKPIYKKDDDSKKFVMVWTSVPFSGLYYYCEVTFDQIYLAYMKQNKDWNPVKSIDLFVNTYLLNCVQFGNETVNIPLMGMPLTTPVPYAKEISPTGHSSIWEMSEVKPVKEFDISTFKLVKVNANKKQIVGVRKKSGKKEVYANVFKKKVKSSDISFEKPETPETRQGVIEETPSKPTQQIPYADEMSVASMEEMEQLEKMIQPPIPKSSNLAVRMKAHYQIIKEDAGLMLVESEKGEYKIIDKETGKEIKEEKSEQPMSPQEVEKKVDDELDAYPNPSPDQEGWVRRKVKKRKPHGIIENLDDENEGKTIAKGSNKNKRKVVRSAKSR